MSQFFLPVIILQLITTLIYLEGNSFYNQQTYHKGSVIYNVEIKYSLKNTSDYNVSYDIRAIDFKDHGQPLPYQKAELKSLMVSGPSYKVSQLITLDEFENAYNLIQFDLNSGDYAEIHQTYEIKITNVRRDFPEDDDIGSYSSLDQKFDKYWKEEEKDCEIFDPDLITR